MNVTDYEKLQFECDELYGRKLGIIKFLANPLRNKKRYLKINDIQK